MSEERFADDLQSEDSQPSSAHQDKARITTITLLILVAWTAASDVFVFRTLGYSGPAAFFAMVPVFLLLGARMSRHRDSYRALFSLPTIVLTLLLLAVSVSLAFAGHGLAVFSGIVLTLALAIACWGVMPLVLETGAYAVRVFFEGFWSLSQSSFPSLRLPAAGGSRQSSVLWSVLLPMIALALFGGIFVFANPDLTSWVLEQIQLASDRFWRWIEGVSVWEIPFCVTAFIVGAGLLYPVFPRWRIGPTKTTLAAPIAGRSGMFAPTRNTLVVLIVLFAVYLVFEFQTLWRRDFPDGFYYAGYAHQGAAWLTFALALATAMVSIIFSGRMLGDHRLRWIRWLAWIWAIQNFLLAAAVYNRLMIYVGYNGMTRMRTVGFFGITVVVVGFILVLVKVRRSQSFWWLIRAQLVALMLAVILYSVFPVDYVAHRYNVSRINDGYLHPSVMVAVKESDDLGRQPMLELIRCSDPLIAEGVKAQLAQRQREIEIESEGSPWHWTKNQEATARLYKRLVENSGQWQQYLDDAGKRRYVIERFQDHAMQWY